MAEGKKSFILYCDLINEIDHLTDEEKGRLFQHLLEYVNDMDPVLEDRVILGTWKPLENKLKRDLKKFDQIREKRRLAGAKGGTKKAANVANASKSNQNVANVADNVNDNDSVNDNVSTKVDDVERVFFKDQLVNKRFHLWLNSCKEQGKVFPQTSLEQMVMKLSYKPSEEVLAMIDQSIENGWKALFDVKKPTRKKGEEEKVSYIPPASVKKAIENLAQQKKAS